MKKVSFTFDSAKGYDLSFVRWFPDDKDLLCRVLSELEVLTTYVNSKEDFDADSLSRIVLEY